MNFFSGQLKVRWTEQEIAELDYFYEEFNDPDTMEKWQKTYSRTWPTGLQADFRSRQPACTADIIQEIVDTKLALTNVGTSYYKMLPGHILPYHQDTYSRYVRVYETEISSIWRFIIFLQDWYPGFVFEIDGHPFVQYPAGAFVAWQGDTPHMAGNLGTVPRYTLQVTGILQ